MVEVITEEPETAPAQLPADTAAPPIGTTDDLDALLQEFSDATAQQPEHEPSPESPDAPASGDDLDAILRDLGPSADQQRITALEGEIGSLR
jgi:hypothetical protein